MYTCQYCNEKYINKSGNKRTCNTCRNGLSRYNMTKVDMQEMHHAQDGGCYLCDKPIEMFIRGQDNCGYIDHCHTTGKVRHILCHICNTLIGAIENDKNNIDTSRLAEYLTITKGVAHGHQEICR